MKIKFNIGKKGSIDILPIFYILMFIFLLGFFVWYYMQPTPPSLSVINMDVDRQQDKIDPTQCNGILTGEVFNNGGVTATGVMVICDLGSGGKYPGVMGIGEVEGRSGVPINISMPLNSCAAAIAQSCEIRCDNCE